MPLSWNEIRDRAVQFSRKWKDAFSEDADAKSFMDDFFKVFGIDRYRTASFEYKLTKFDGKTGYADLLWKGKLLIEQKSKGKSLDDAYKQAKDYLLTIPQKELPHYVLVCDFENFRLRDMGTEETVEFKLKDFPTNIKHFGFIAGYETHTYKEQDPVNIQAAERMGKLHDELKQEIGYTGHDLEVLLVRLLFCLFADNTGIFLPQGIFREYIEQRTSEDGKDLAERLDNLFQVLNQQESERFRTLDEQLAQFPYVNGQLFGERLRTADFTAKMRKQLLECCELNWSAISPAIFGALFQSIMDKNARRNLGAHYTSEQNILKLIRPLFLDALWDEFNKITRSPQKLTEFQKKLRSLIFLDPACGCGNFLVIAYREIRLLEFEVLRLLHKEEQLLLDLRELLLVNVDQFFGIEIEEFPAQIAQVALWLVDHQMNTMVGTRFGQHFARIPLITSPTIINTNAIPLEWESVVQKTRLHYILGNPPFVGSKFLSPRQKQDTHLAFEGMDGGGTLDYVCAWYVKSAKFIKGTRIVASFVSTNSISQGEQAGILWIELLKLGMKIHFAHRTFQWQNEAKGMAAVHCVIEGFANFDTDKKTIFDYSDIKGEPQAISVKNVNPYLVDAPDVTLPSRYHPLSNVPAIGIGNKPIDGGNYLFSPQERDAFIKIEPASKKWFRRWIGSDEFLNGYERWCLWLGECSPEELRKMPEAIKRVQTVQKLRLASKSEPTRKLAATPTRFHVENMPKKSYVVVPKVSSERRPYIPIGFESPKTLSSDLLFIIPDATLFHVGVLSSSMHMAWVRYTCGRLKSDYRYSKDIVYNNFPWPEAPTAKQKEIIEQAAQSVLDTRKKYPDSSLADLYDPLTMPADLLKAHQKLDKAVDAAYGKRKFATEAERVAYLFELYQNLTTPLLPVERKSRKKRAPSLHDSGS